MHTAHLPYPASQHREPEGQPAVVRHAPQLSVPPQPSETVPHRVPQVWGTQTQASWADVHAYPDWHVPQNSGPPHHGPGTRGEARTFARIGG